MLIILWGLTMHSYINIGDQLVIKLCWANDNSFPGSRYFSRVTITLTPEKYNKNLDFWAESCLEEMPHV